MPFAWISVSASASPAASHHPPIESTGPHLLINVYSEGAWT
ncbi:hypothetical protein ACFPOI_01035 [Nonomuraea angiospora]|uniref:Uncharacterized protein n=1 Tax=Nonomuraea angiospora TaxID=46172 RepID=A0ABR9M280_9ACTN|nr:hypothetical protein [Nonomuraea angiospora]MBE1586988.1 hypothetical protein [Nonomuraea angiospora]